MTEGFPLTTVWYLHKMVAHDTLRTPGVNKVIRSDQGSCVHRQKLEIICNIIYKKV